MAGAATAWQAARQAGEAVRARLPDAAPDDLLHLALSERGFACRPLRPGDPLLSGAHAVLDTEVATVWVRDDAAPADRRVYLAHELAHIHLHESGGDGETCACHEADFADIDGAGQAVGYGPRQRRETHANVFARAFLLPRTLAHRLFGEGLSAADIAARLGLPHGVVVAQLAEGLTPGDDTEILPELAADPPPATYALDPTQEAAAYAPRGPLLVGAGPGTGKTRTLTARILHLTQNLGVRPENLLALTFSRKAADEMRERVAAQSPRVAQQAAISTFHAYGFDLLRRWGKVAGLPPNPVLLDVADACALLERHIPALGLTALRYLHDPAWPLPDIVRAVHRAKEDLIPPADFARRAHATGDAKLADVARVYTAYETLLREAGYLDFPDLVSRALRLLQDNPDVLASERRQWQHILVDEYQDINRAGALLVQALTGGERAGAGLWAVGDLRQAIYRFRGASPANVTGFETDFPGSARAELGVNYRSRAALVRLFGASCGEGETTWQAARGASPDATITLAVAGDDRAQAGGMAQMMQTFHNEWAWRDMVVLCRTRGQIRQMRTALLALGVPVAPVAGENDLLASPDVRDLLLLLARAAESGSVARARYPALPPGLRPTARGGGDAHTFLCEALWGAGRRAETVRDPDGVLALLRLARAFRDREDLLTFPGDDPARAFLGHIRRLLRLGVSLTTGGDEAETDAVRVLTVHAAKGLEFPVVFVPNLSAGKFPSRPAPAFLPALPDEEIETEHESAEEARLFFVALTRARDHLVLSRAEKYGTMSARPSPLLAAVGEFAGLHHVVWPASPVSEKDAAPDTPAPPTEGDLTLPLGDVELYLRCPRRYYYSRICQIAGGEWTPYEAFKQAVNSALADPAPQIALAGHWSEKGPDDTHPWSALYRQTAEEIVARPPVRLPGRPSAPTPNAPDVTVALPHGAVSVRPPHGEMWEEATFRKPPADARLPADADLGLSLLQVAAEQSGQPAASVHLRYLQTGQTQPVADKPRQRAKHLETLDRALVGIRLNIFPALPPERSDCAVCPYLLVCPDEISPDEISPDEISPDEISPE